MNINECPAAPVVPVYVMVGGILALLLMGLLALPKLLCPAAMAHKIWNLLILSIVLLVFIWFIFGESNMRLKHVHVHVVIFLPKDFKLA